MEDMKRQRLNSAGDLLGFVPGEPQEKRELGLQYSNESMTSGLPAPVHNSDSENMLTTHFSALVYQTHPSDNIASDLQAITSKQDSSPSSPGELEMPTLVPQVLLDKDQNAEDVFCPSSMPDLKNSIAMNNPPESSFPELRELPMQSLEGQTIQADCVVGPLEANCIKSTLPPGVNRRSQENFSELSPSTLVYMLGTQADGSPVDDERQAYNRNPIPQCKGQVLNTEHSPGYSHRDNFDASSVEGEGSRPIQSPGEPRSDGSECISNSMQTVDAYGFTEDDHFLNAEALVTYFESPQADEDIRLQEADTAVDNVNCVSQKFGVGDGQNDCGFEDIPKLTSFLDSSSTPNDCVQDEDTCCQELPELIPEKADIAIGSPVNALPLVSCDFAVAAPSKAVSEWPDQKIYQIRISHSPLKTRGACGRKRKSYHEFYDNDHDSDEDDETFSPRGPPRRKKRMATLKRRRSSQNQAACSRAHHQVSIEKYENSDLLLFAQQTLAFDRVETKLSRVLQTVEERLAGLQPGSVKFYRVLSGLGGVEDELVKKFEDLSIKEGKEKDLKPIVIVVLPSKGRLNLLCASVAGLLEKSEFHDLGRIIRRSGDEYSKMMELDILLDKLISVKFGQKSRRHTF